MATNHLWQWHALTAEGELQQGTLWEKTREAALVQLWGKDIYPLTLSRRFITTQWKREHCFELFRQLSTLLQAGLPLALSLTMLAEQQTSWQWQALLQSLADDLSAGSAFSEAMQKWPEVFTPLYVSMIKTGELTGKLEECCRQLAHQQKTQQQLRVKVKKALRYPIIILTLAVAVVLAMVTLVLPEFAAIYKTFNTPLPMLTRMVMGFADVVREYFIVIILAVTLPVVARPILRKYAVWQRFSQRTLLQIPVTGTLIRGQKLSQIFTVLSLTQHAGIAFLQGLESTLETIEERFWKEQLEAVKMRVTQGDPVWSSFQAADVFTPLCVQLIRTGEATGALDTMLDNLARHHNEQTFQHADNLASLLEPLLLIVTGIIIGTLVVAMYLPIFHLGDAMSVG